MGTLSTVAQRPLSPERARLVDAVKRSRYTLRELSDALGRNPSYLQQFIVKGSPRALPEDVRHRLASILHIDEADIREVKAAPPPPPPLPLVALAPVPAPSDQGKPAPAEETRRGDRAALLPMVSEDRIGEDAELGALYPVSAVTANIPGRAVAVQLVHEHGVLQPRHVLICDPAIPPRIGDVAVVRAPSCPTAIGLLVGGPKGTVTVREGGEDQQLPADSAVAWRVLAVRCD